MTMPTTTTTVAIDPALPFVAETLSHIARAAQHVEAEEEEEKGKARRERNRLAAKKSRGRRRDKMHEAVGQLEALQRDMDALRAEWAAKELSYKERIVVLEAQNKVLMSGDWTRLQMEKTQALQLEVSSTKDEIAKLRDALLARKNLGDHKLS
jgi:hypothetical protein